MNDNTINTAFSVCELYKPNCHHQYGCHATCNDNSNDDPLQCLGNCDGHLIKLTDTDLRFGEIYNGSGCYYLDSSGPDQFIVLTSTVLIIVSLDIQELQLPQLNACYTQCTHNQVFMHVNRSCGKFNDLFETQVRHHNGNSITVGIEEDKTVVYFNNCPKFILNEELHLPF